MRFLTFNLAVAAALFYLMTGGDIQQAKALITPSSDPVSEAKVVQPVKPIVTKALAKLADLPDAPEKALDALAKTLKVESVDTGYMPPERRAAVKKPAPAPKAKIAKLPPLAQLPPLDGERVVEQKIPQLAPHGVSAGIAPKPAPQTLPKPEVVAEVSASESVAMDEDKQLARKKELSRMVFDMERLFAEKLTR